MAGERRRRNQSQNNTLSPLLFFLSFLAGVMGVRAGLSFFLVLIVSCIYADARRLEISDVKISQVIPTSETEFGEEEVSSKRVCAICEQFTSEAVKYLAENKTKMEIIDSFHQACLHLRTFQQQCASLVDYYAPLFFGQISSISPREFCTKVNLCEDIPPPPPTSEYNDPLDGDRACILCHRAVLKVLTKLKDPGTELKIVEKLVKACILVERIAQRCQKVIFEYGPVILVNTVKLLEKSDICTKIHACAANQTEVAEAFAPIAMPVEVVPLPMRGDD